LEILAPDFIFFIFIHEIITKMFMSNFVI